MKKFLLFLLCGIGLSAGTFAQTFTTQYDTTGMPPGGDTVSGSTFINNYITNTGLGSLIIKWTVVGTDFPRDWWHAVTPSGSPRLGICDNKTCYNNDTTLMPLWNGTKGDTFTSSSYDPSAAGDFHMVLDLTSASGGTHWLTVNLKDANSSYNKNVTFLVTKGYLGVSTIVKSTDDVVLYPNPAINEVNLVYNANAGVKNIAVYNLIGGVVRVYKVTSNNSAKLQIGDLPSGVYFARLMNAQGNVVATRKFTRQ